MDKGALSGSREPSRVTPSRPVGFDPARVANQLGNAQRDVILSLDAEFWGPATSHACAKRMFWGVRGGWYLVDHKHRTDNCWSLTPRGAAVKEALYAIAAGTRESGDVKQAPSEGCQSVIAQTPSESSNEQ